MQIVKRYSPRALVLTKKIAKSILLYTLPLFFCVYMCRVYVICVTHISHTVLQILEFSELYVVKYILQSSNIVSIKLSHLTAKPYLELQERTVKYQEKYLLLNIPDHKAF